MHIMPVTERLMYVGASGGGERDSGSFVAPAIRAARPGVGPGGTPPATEACPPQHNARTGAGNADSDTASGRAAAEEGVVLREDGEGRPVSGGCRWPLLLLLLLALLLVLLLPLPLLSPLALLLLPLSSPSAQSAAHTATAAAEEWGGEPPPLPPPLSIEELGAIGAERPSAGEGDCPASKGPFSAKPDTLSAFDRAAPSLRGAFSLPPPPPLCPSRDQPPETSKPPTPRGAAAAENAGGGGSWNDCSGNGRDVGGE